jgi:23S rRNA (guanosine2251-2'-O)-methyltransferase
MVKDNIIYGIHPVLEALRSSTSLEKIVLQKGKHTSAIQEIKELVSNKNIKLQFLPVEAFRKYKELNHQGIIAFQSPIDLISIEQLINNCIGKEKLSFLLLDGVTDVRNLGAIIRNAESMDFDAVIIPDNNSAMINETVVKTSAGAIYNLAICKVNHLVDALMYLKAEAIDCLAITEKSDNIIYEYGFSDKVALVLGDEGKGISRKVLNLCDKQIKIPLTGKTSSLNVSVAAGIALYERTKQSVYR